MTTIVDPAYSAHWPPVRSGGPNLTFSRKENEEYIFSPINYIFYIGDILFYDNGVYVSLQFGKI